MTHRFVNGLRIDAWCVDSKDSVINLLRVCISQGSINLCQIDLSVYSGQWLSKFEASLLGLAAGSPLSYFNSFGLN